MRFNLVLGGCAALNTSAEVVFVNEQHAGYFAEAGPNCTPAFRRAGETRMESGIWLYGKSGAARAGGVRFGYRHGTMGGACMSLLGWASLLSSEATKTMARYYSRSTDKNQKVIVADLRKVPRMKVKIISRAGRPAGDLLVKYGGRLLEVEVKRPGEHLNPNQVEELEKWGDDCYLVAETTEDILRWFDLMA